MNIDAKAGGINIYNNKIISKEKFVIIKKTTEKKISYMRPVKNLSDSIFKFYHINIKFNI